MSESEISHQNREFLRAFTAHEPAVRAFIRRLVPSRVDADDILQDVAVVLWEKYGEFQAGGDFRAWACGIARFKVLAWLRDRGRDRLVLDSDVVAALAEESLQVESHLDRQRAALETCFEKMPVGERELLARAYRRDVRIQDVAVTSGRSVGGFYQWLHRVRKMLLECVNRQMAEEPLT